MVHKCLVLIATSKNRGTRLRGDPKGAYPSDVFYVNVYNLPM